MKYYAVTNDPTELMHFGIKGMHWGIRRSDAQLGHPRHSGSRRPRSAAYKKAQSKLGKAMKNGIEKAKANWREYNSPERKYERQTNKALQQARKGKLKYGKLDDWQVQRITDRLAMERDARMLSNTEKKWGKRLRESIGEGVIRGVGEGFGRRTSEWISRGSTLKTDRLRKEQSNSMDLEQRRRLNDIDREYERQKLIDERKNARQKAMNEANAEYYKEAAKRGYSPTVSALRAGRLPSIQTNRERMKQLNAWNERNYEEERQRSRDSVYDKTYGAEHAKAQVKLDYPGSKNSEKKKDKSKKKNKSKDLTMPPINIYTYDPNRNRVNRTGRRYVKY